MHIHIWRMRARKKRADEYEKFGRQVTLPALKKIDGCLDAHFIKVFEARKPEYLWLVFWRDQAALEAARTNPVWRDQIKKFEAGKFYKTIPLELVCESLASSAAPGAEKARKPEKVEKADKAEKAEKPEPSSKGFVGPTPEGE
jgi:quinol monooxygenase YgiN